MGPLEIKFLVFLGVLIGLEQANAIDCYSCISTMDSSCNDPFKTSGAHTVSCTGSCSKIKGKESTSNIEVTVRRCGNAEAADKCSESTLGTYSGTECLCTGNLCNIALPVGGSFIVMTAAMIVYVGLR